MEKRYNALRLLASFMKVVGIIVALLTILAFIGIFGMGILGGTALESLNRQVGQDAAGLGVLMGTLVVLFLSIAPIVSGLLLALSLFAGGEMISLQIDIEENTRFTQFHLRSLTQLLAHSPGLAVPAPGGVLQPALAISGPLPVSLDKPRYYSYCPQCGEKITTSDPHCPQCSYDLTQI